MDVTSRKEHQRRSSEEVTQFMRESSSEEEAKVHGAQEILNSARTSVIIVITVGMIMCTGSRTVRHRCQV